MKKRGRQKDVNKESINETLETGGLEPMANRIQFSPPDQIEFRIPKDLLTQFEVEPRIVIRWPWIIGIPIPDWLIKNPELLGRAAEEFEPMLIPRQMLR